MLVAEDLQALSKSLVGMVRSLEMVSGAKDRNFFASHGESCATLSG